VRYREKFRSRRLNTDPDNAIPLLGDPAEPISPVLFREIYRRTWLMAIVE
jgi:hypothetical protein